MSLVFAGLGVQAYLQLKPDALRLRLTAWRAYANIDHKIVHEGIAVSKEAGVPCIRVGTRCQILRVFGTLSCAGNGDERS